MSRAGLAAFSAGACLLFAPLAQAHKASDAYVTLRVDGAVVDARIDIALRDLDRDIDLDTDADDQLSWKEVRTRWIDIAALARNGLHLSADGALCTAEPAGAPVTNANQPALTQHSDGAYAVVRTNWLCAAPVQRLSVEYGLFAKTDPTHRGIVQVMRANSALEAPRTQLAVLSPGHGWHRFKLEPLPAGADNPSTAGGSTARATTAESATSVQTGVASVDAATTGADEAPTSSFLGFVRAGVHHILIGYDHILFLLSLLLPAVWNRGQAFDPGDSRRRGRWSPSDDWRAVLTNVLKVVTAFTVAHSMTLALSVLDVVNPPPRWVESIIAASVVLAALNNIWPVISDSRWKLTFVFGLVHGFGFASALKDAGLAKGALAAPLVGFNLGVEIGQLCIVAAVLPLAWIARDTRGYRAAFTLGSLAIAVIAGLWFVQRALDLSIVAG